MSNTSKQYSVVCNAEFREILMAEFAAINFDSFQETDIGFIAHASIEPDSANITSIIERYAHQAGAYYKVDEVKIENWNKKWEESYQPIQISDKIIIRASFHDPNPGYPIDIIINPKMSFGTGHHETTSLMMEGMLEILFDGKEILDAGCGTGILSILAGKLGARKIAAYDNDPWVESNIQENFRINHTNADILIGTVQSLELDPGYDIVMANINKNILLADIPFYADLLTENGDLLLSGFYKEDLADLIDIASKNDLEMQQSKTKNNWMMARFSKVLGYGSSIFC